MIPSYLGLIHFHLKHLQIQSKTNLFFVFSQEISIQLNESSWPLSQLSQIQYRSSLSMEVHCIWFYHSEVQTFCTSWGPSKLHLAQDSIHYMLINRVYKTRNAEAVSDKVNIIPGLLLHDYEMESIWVWPFAS